MKYPPMLLILLFLPLAVLAQETSQEPVGEVGQEDAYRQTHEFGDLDVNEDFTIDLDEAEGAVPDRDWDDMDSNSDDAVTRGEYDEWFYDTYGERDYDSQLNEQ